MSMLLVILLLALVAVGVFLLLRRSKASTGNRHNPSQPTARHERRIKGDRRSGRDKREDIRFDLEKTPRRSGEGRRQQDNLWKKDD